MWRLKQLSFLGKKDQLNINRVYHFVIIDVWGYICFHITNGKSFVTRLDSEKDTIQGGISTPFPPPFLL